jgi:hypothetical protein
MPVRRVMSVSETCCAQGGKRQVSKGAEYPLLQHLIKQCHTVLMGVM